MQVPAALPWSTPSSWARTTTWSRPLGRDPSAVTVYREDAGDLAAMRAVIEREQPDIVFNLATKALLYSFFNPSGACRVNLDIALALLELLRGGAYGRLVHLSSSEVYGTARVRPPMDEEHPLLAETTYAAGQGRGRSRCGLLRSHVRPRRDDGATVQQLRARVRTIRPSPRSSR